MKAQDLDLKDYVGVYQGHARIFRLLAIVEAVVIDGAQVDDGLVQLAIQMGLDMAAEARALGLYFKIQGLAQKWAANQGKQIGQLAANSQVNISQVQAEYNTALKKKEAEISSQMKTLIKDSMRISLKELG